MPIPTNDWYTIQAGDTLSKIAKEAGFADWKTIYNDPKNVDFRKKCPDPDKIYAGDKIWIPEKLKTATGKKTVFVAPAEKIQVTEIYFDSQVDIHYVRLLPSHPDYIAPGVPANPGYLHLNPPKIYPEVDKPNWIFDVSTSKPSESWPTVLIRNNATSSKLAKRDLLVCFSSDIPFDGDRTIKAECASGEVTISEQKVSFKKGTTAKILFSFTKVPSTVDKLANISLIWSAKKDASSNYIEICKTQHTFYIIDEKPKKANLRRADINLFDVIDWSCVWARGTSGQKAVVDAIWKEFSPVKAAHSTGLEYWKNWDHPTVQVQPYQTIDFAIKGKDDQDPLSRNSASCAVFDNIFINALTLHGISSAEIMILPSKKSKAIFNHRGKRYKCIAFNGTSIKGQGNFNAPPTWQNHWIANIKDFNAKWKLYDPSYGVAPYDSDDPYVNNPIDVQKYEKAGVKDFMCDNLDDGVREDLPAGVTSTMPPHLQGDVLWKP